MFFQFLFSFNVVVYDRSFPFAVILSLCVHDRLLLSITRNIWMCFRRSGLVKQALSVEVVLICVTEWSKRNATLDDEPRNDVFTDNSRLSNIYTD